ncbi:MAG: cupin domain-containing protein [Dehalococcoidia bacterium]
MKRYLIAAAALAALVILPQRPAVTQAQPSAQLPPGPRTVHQSAMELAMPTAPMDAVQMVLDFAPGAWTPPHSHGGDVLVTVLAGTMTFRGSSGEQAYQAGETWTERAGEVHAAGNNGSEPARLLATFLLPDGAPLTTVEQTGSAELPPGPTTVTRSSLRLTEAPSAMNLVQVQLDFAPDAWTPPHWHGGPLLVTVLDGELAMRQQGTERTFSEGDLWIEYPGIVHAAGNKTSETATVVVSFLMPRGGRLTSIVQ